MATRERRLSPASAPHVDTGKYVRYTPEQVEALERVYGECPKPTSLRRQQLIRECSILRNIEPKQIKVWFQNRRSAPNRSVLPVLERNVGKEAPFQLDFLDSCAF
jgi:homeobox-leucine zipper protein